LLNNNRSEEKVTNSLLKGLDCSEHVGSILNAILKHDNGNSHQSLLSTLESLYPSQFDKSLSQILSEKKELLKVVSDSVNGKRYQSLKEGISIHLAISHPQPNLRKSALLSLHSILSSNHSHSDKQVRFHFIFKLFHFFVLLLSN